MNFAGTMTGNSVAVRGRRVTLVTIEAVAWVSHRVLTHPLVSGSLCKDTCGHDLRDGAVASHDSLSISEPGRYKTTIDTDLQLTAEDLHLRLQAAYRSIHCTQGGVVDVELVDLRG